MTPRTPSTLPLIVILLITLCLGWFINTCGDAVASPAPESADIVIGPTSPPKKAAQVLDAGTAGTAERRAALQGFIREVGERFKAANGVSLTFKIFYSDSVPSNTAIVLTTVPNPNGEPGPVFAKFLMYVGGEWIPAPAVYAPAAYEP